jgi:hypothetical protein
MQKNIEGTMINLFYSNNIWEIATKSTVGGNINFYKNYEESNKTFRSMFFEICEYIGFDFDILNKQYCYSFVMQHVDNRIVIPIDHNSLYLLKIYKINNKIVEDIPMFITENDGHINYNKNIVGDLLNFINIPIIKKCNKFDVLEYNATVDPYHKTGYMIYAPDGTRSKIVNLEYIYVKKLRDNQPKLQYLYLSTRKTGKMTELLNYYPEYAEKFNIYRSQLHKFTIDTHNQYYMCFIKKKFKLKDAEPQYKNILYNLHSIYLKDLVNNNKNVTKSVVIDYINNLHPAQQMYLINYNLH